MKNIFTYILLLLLLTTPCYAQKKKTTQKSTTASSATVSSLKTQQAKALKELEHTKQMLQETTKSEAATQNKLTLLDRSIRQRKQVISDLNTEIGNLNTEMNMLGIQRDSLEQHMQLLKDDYALLVQKTHYTMRHATPLLFILSAKDYQQMVRRLRYMQDLQTHRKMQVERIIATQNEIDEKNTLLLSYKSSKEEAIRMQKQEQETLTRDQRKQNSMLQELKKKEKELLAQQKKQQQKADELNRKIEEAISKEVSTTTKLTKEQTLLAGGFEKNKGRLPWPVERGFISGHFGTQQHPTLSQVTINNKGIYIQSTQGTRARAVYDGEVTTCMSMGGTTAIIIQHGNYRTVYSGLKSVSVKKGDKVKAKQTIGTIYSDPDQDNATQLFFQIYKDRTIIDPESWLAK
ncbi:MAG: peptidoglycan DD-metalloendopeptidase family protein [Paludibacteraceae bacterium]|nr:peptidoglycan DD-metalloendopeptidase family protein [Paludibacteraceae bacterium]